MDELLVICKLVRMAVFGTEEEIPTGVNWPKLFADSGINGVSAICYEAVKRLPADRQPDFSLMLRWDLDFVARPGFEACNAFVESLGIEVKSQEKYTSFVYKGIHFENHTLEPTGGYNRIHHRTVKLLRDSMPEAVQRPDGCLELSPVAQAIFIVKHTSQHICYSGGKIALRMLLDLALLLRRYPDILDKWEPGLRKVGLYRFSRAMLCATDQLLGTGFQKEWSGHMRRRARRFSYLFLTESNRYIRYFAKFGFLPLNLSEMLRIWYEKAGTLLHRRNE